MAPTRRALLKNLAKNEYTEQLQQSELDVPDIKINDDENSDIMRDEDYISYDDNEIAEISVPKNKKIGIVEELIKR